MMKQHLHPMEWAEDFGAIGAHSSLVRSASIRLPFFSAAIRHTRGLSALIPSFLEACRSLRDAVDEAMKALLADSMLTFHRVTAKTIEIRLLRVRTERANCSRCIAMLNDDWIHVLIAHGNRQVAAFLAAGSLILRDAAAGAIRFEVDPVHAVLVFVGRSSWAT
jgi:hypothetical protein